MTVPVARVGDKFFGICNHGSPDCPHVVMGDFITGFPGVLANGMAVVRMGDKGFHSCPHDPMGEAITGGVHQAGSKGMHRLGGKVDTGGGTSDTITASPNVLSK